MAAVTKFGAEILRIN